MTGLLITGALLGLNAGLTPGPLLTLVIAESLRGGWPAGFRVCLAPLITDSLVITLALVVMGPLPPWGLSVVSIIGGLIIVWMGWGAARSAPPAAAEAAVAGTSSAFWKGVGTNLLNPHAYLFWLTAGGPVVKGAASQFGWVGPIAFMAAFFVVMIGLTIVIAFGVSRGGRFLQGSAYRWTLALSGLALALFGLYRVYEGVMGLL